MDHLNGSYFYGPSENDKWLKELDAEFDFNEEALLRRELKRIQRSTKKYNIDKYQDYFLSVATTAGQTIFNPVLRRHDGAVCVAQVPSGEVSVCLVRGSLLCTAQLTELGEDDLDYVSFLVGATNGVTKPEFYSRNGVTYYSEFITFYEKGYLTFQNCCSKEVWEGKSNQAANEIDRSKIITLTSVSGEEFEYIIEPALIIEPERMNYLSVLDEEGNKVYR